MDAENSNHSYRGTALIASELSRDNIDMAVLSETRLADEGSLNEMASSYTIFWKGLPANSRRIHGVRFAIRTKLLRTLPESSAAVSERLMTLKISLAKHRHATFISTYAPTLPSDDETKDHCYAILRFTILKVPRREKFIVFGDFSARVGSESMISGNAMGKHWVSNINGNGHRLLILRSGFGLLVTNTIIQPVSVAQKNKPSTTLSSNVQSIDLLMDCTAWRFWTMRQSNGCSTLAPISRRASSG